MSSFRRCCDACLIVLAIGALLVAGPEAGALAQGRTSGQRTGRGATTAPPPVATPPIATPTPAPAAGTVTGFVRVNGESLELKHAYGFIVPDSFTETERVKLVLVSPTPIAESAIAAAVTRRELTRLLEAGAIVEVRGQNHTVFLRHAVLKDQEIQTGGDFTPKTDSPTRVAGKVTTFMSGDEEKFGFKVRFEITFDAPVLKTITRLK